MNHPDASTCNHQPRGDGTAAHAGHHHGAVANLRVAFFLNLTFTIIEICGGLLTNSIAILSDALHDLGDSLSLGMAWFLQNYSEKQEDQKFSFGYRRFSLLGSLISSIVLVFGSLFILSEAVPRLWSSHRPPHAPGMMALAVLGILVNGGAALRLTRGKSLNERVVTWHLIEDVLGWVAVFAVSVILMFRDIPILDPILSILITLWVLYNVVGNLKKTLFVFLQGVPEGIPVTEVKRRIRQIPHVRDIHNLRLWSMDGEYKVLSLHVVLQQHATIEEMVTVKRMVKTIGRDQGIDHMTVELEFSEDDCSQKAPGNEAHYW